MLFAPRFLPGIARGDITLAFRRWTRPRALAGKRHRTPVGFIEIEAVDPVCVDDVSQREAQRAGFGSPGELRNALGRSGSPLYRIRFRRVDAVDARDELAERRELSSDEAAEIAARLRRMDNSKRRPWTAQTLELIRLHPARRAADLAAMAGRETLDFKRDVRRLKEMGLTLSLEVGYRLSPRGKAFLAMTQTPSTARAAD